MMNKKMMFRITSHQQNASQSHKIPLHGLPWWPSSEESTCNAANMGDTGSVPGLGRTPGGQLVTHSSTLAWRIPWTEEPGGLQSMGHKESDTAETTKHAHTISHPTRRL